MCVCECACLCAHVQTEGQSDRCFGLYTRSTRVYSKHPRAVPRTHTEAAARGTCSRRCAAFAAAPEFKSPDAFGVRYGFGSAGGTSCPTGMVTMSLLGDLCERAASVAGRPYGGTATMPFMPVDCVWSSAGGSFYFNVANRGSSHASAQPVCASAPDSTHQRYQSRANICLCMRVYVGVPRACRRACVCVPVCVFRSVCV